MALGAHIGFTPQAEPGRSWTPLLGASSRASLKSNHLDVSSSVSATWLRCKLQILGVRDSELLNDSLVITWQSLCAKDNQMFYDKTFPEKTTHTCTLHIGSPQQTNICTPLESTLVSQ